MTDMTAIEAQPTGVMTMAPEMKYTSDSDALKRRLNLHLARVWLLQVKPTIIDNSHD